MKETAILIIGFSVFIGSCTAVKLRDQISDLEKRVERLEKEIRKK